MAYPGATRPNALPFHEAHSPMAKMRGSLERH